LYLRYNINLVNCETLYVILTLCVIFNIQLVNLNAWLIVSVLLIDYTSK